MRLKSQPAVILDVVAINNIMYKKSCSVMQGHSYLLRPHFAFITLLNI